MSNITVMDSIKLARDLDDDVSVSNSKNKSLPNINHKEFFESVSSNVNNQPSKIIKEKVIITQNRISITEMFVIILFFVILNTKFIIHLIYAFSALELNPHSHYFINLLIRTFIFAIILYLIRRYPIY